MAAAETFAKKAFSGGKEADVFLLTIANYVVAADRNHAVNQKKAQLLTGALMVYLSGLSVLLLSCVSFALFSLR